MLLTAATTEGSSTTMGTTRSTPLIRRLRPRPTGSPKTPMQFSIILSARSQRRPAPFDQDVQVVVRQAETGAQLGVAGGEIELVEAGDARVARGASRSWRTLQTLGFICI
jgi:hypothetical protein